MPKGYEKCFKGTEKASRVRKSVRGTDCINLLVLTQIRKSNILIHLLYLLHEKGADMVRKDEGFYLIKRNIKDNFPKENRNSNKV